MFLNVLFDKMLTFVVLLVMLLVQDLARMAMEVVVWNSKGRRIEEALSCFDSHSHSVSFMRFAHCIAVPAMLWVRQTNERSFAVAESSEICHVVQTCTNP